MPKSTLLYGVRSQLHSVLIQNQIIRLRWCCRYILG